MAECWEQHNNPKPEHAHNFNIKRRAQVRLETCQCGETRVVEEIR